MWWILDLASEDQISGFFLFNFFLVKDKTARREGDGGSKETKNHPLVKELAWRS